MKLLIHSPVGSLLEITRGRASLGLAQTETEKPANYYNVFINDDGFNKDFFFVALSGGS